MPRNGRTSITVKVETFETLAERKPEGVTWDYFLQELVGIPEVPTNFLNLLSAFFDDKSKAIETVENVDWLGPKERERWFQYLDHQYNLERPNQPV